jgi:hypothetical protein
MTATGIPVDNGVNVEALLGARTRRSAVPPSLLHTDYTVPSSVAA